MSVIDRGLRLLPLLAVLCTVLPASAEEELPAYGRFQFDDYEREHWAFVPVVRPDVPQVADQDWVRTPIDAFILAELEDDELVPAADADRLTLLRRVYFDLIGLPPTPDEQAAFLQDDSPDAYERVVDDLLARPQYGERWARHWLDVVRYAESNGYERDNPKPHAWRYRDYVIRAFNEDKPFDRFLIEQLAGDELPDSNAETQIATTFLRLGLWDDEPADPVVDRYDQLDDVLDATATTFMGLSIRCARCHDHKYEPLSQRDYTRMLAIFEPLQRPRDGRTDLDRHVGTADELATYRDGMAQADTKVSQLQQQIDTMRSAIQERALSGATELPEEVVAALRTPVDERSQEQEKLIAEHRPHLEEEMQRSMAEDERVQLAAWDEEIGSTNAARPEEPPRAYIWYEDGPSAPVAHLFERGDPHQPRDEVPVGHPAVLVDAPPPSAEPTDHSTGRRLQLARWLASIDHPLTARVFVNRLWQHHFGVGMVGTVNDFGLMGDAPTHPELLDWLASELMTGQWRVKPLQRMIVTSHAYRVAAVPADQNDGRDAEGEKLSLWRPRRLEAEAIRDAMLAASGDLNLQAGGPSVFPPISQAVLATQSIPGNGWKASEPDQANRRSVYVFVKRTLLVPELEVLDFPRSNESCGARNVSTVAPQSLTYFNGDFANQQAGRLADRLVSEVGEDTSLQIDRAFRLTLCRPPTPEEQEAVAQFLDVQARQIAADDASQSPDEPPGTPRQRALASLCLVLFNSNEFFYIH